MAIWGLILHHIYYNIIVKTLNKILWSKLNNIRYGNAKLILKKSKLIDI